jgi:hypothetical protein
MAITHYKFKEESEMFRKSMVVILVVLAAAAGVYANAFAAIENSFRFCFSDRKSFLQTAMVLYGAIDFKKKIV